MVAGMAMKVSTPFSGSSQYDVGVDREGPALRVQVKSTIHKREDCYHLSVIGAHRELYKPGTVDFFAILLIPIDDWYIIPFDAVGRTNRSLFLAPQSKPNKYRKYREAWHLLKETGLTIQACCDPDWLEVAEGTADSSLRSE
jgi:hypothetical protein